MKAREKITVGEVAVIQRINRKFTRTLRHRRGPQEDATASRQERRADSRALGEFYISRKGTVVESTSTSSASLASLACSRMGGHRQGAARQIGGRRP